MTQQSCGQRETRGIPLAHAGPRIAICAGAMALVVLVGVAVGQPARRGPASGGPGGLADLLDAQDRPEQDGADGKPAGNAQRTDRPVAGTMPEAQPQQLGGVIPPNGTVVDRLRQAIEDRHATVSGTRLLETLATIDSEEGILAGLQRTLQQCDVALTATRREVNRLQTMGLAGGPGADVAALEIPAAQMALAQAASRFEGQRLMVQAKQQDLQPLYAHAVGAINSWMDHYRDMRRCVGQDRRDPNGVAVVEALEAEIAARPDFHDGRVLVAVAHTYHGDPAKAAAHLRAAQANDGFGKHLGVLSSTDVGFDRALAWVLLGEPKEITNEMRAWDARWLNHKSPRHLWLLALAHAAKGQDQESERRFDRCLRAAGFNETTDPPAICTAYLGDAAFFYLTTSNPKYLRVERARKILARIPEGEGRWQVLRARAADLAERGDWKEAVKTLQDCERRCPLTLVDEVRGQVSAYEREQTWTRPPPPKKKPAS